METALGLKVNTNTDKMDLAQQLYEENAAFLVKPVAYDQCFVQDLTCLCQHLQTREYKATTPQGGREKEAGGGREEKKHKS